MDTRAIFNVAEMEYLEKKEIHKRILKEKGEGTLYFQLKKFYPEQVIEKYEDSVMEKIRFDQYIEILKDEIKKETKE